MKSIKNFISPILLTLAAVIWGFAFSAQKSAENVPSFTLGMARSFIAAFFLIIVIVIFDKVFHTERVLFSKKKIFDFNKNELIGGALCGAVLAIASFLQQYGINSGAEAGKASFITALYVVLVPIYALALRKKAPINVWISLPFAAVGFYFLCITGEFKMLLPDVFVLSCALIFPIHILTIDKYSPVCDGTRMSCVQFFTAGVINLIFALIFEYPIKTDAVAESILPILFLGIGSSGIAYTLQILGQKGVNPAAASILLSLESVFGVLGSALFLGEVMTYREYIGCATVFVAVIISQLNLDSLFNKKTKTEKHKLKEH